MLVTLLIFHESLRVIGGELFLISPTGGLVGGDRSNTNLVLEGSWEDESLGHGGVYGGTLRTLKPRVTTDP